ncbi:hypothetical protein [Allofournierella sp.]|uniref:hypothetical protein n=2 Tax=Allofournierella sp. TaxID=1940256 RepID=UPI003AB2363F
MNIKQIPWKRLAGYGGLLLALWAAFSLLLGGSAALIPRAAIEPNMRACAEYYAGQPGFENLGGDKSAVIHNYADAVSLNLIWSVDESRPFRSAFEAPYYDPGDEQTSGVELAETVLHGAAPDSTYGRYWHGSTVLLRALLTVTDIQGVRVVNGAALGLLTLLFFALLARRRLWALLAAGVFAALYCKCWVVPLCVEYMACFVLMLAFGCLILALEGRVQRWTGCFLAVGALTCYFDFLTCEILTLFVPVLLLLGMRYAGRENCRAGALRATAGWGAAWGAGYALSWAAKWMLTALFTGQSVVDIALKAGVSRAVGDTHVAGVGLQAVDALLVNVGRVWPMNGSMQAGYIAVCAAAACFGLFAVWYLFRGRPRPGGLAPVLLAVGATPFARWMALSNHSALHPFMTYRDLIITLLALALFYGETLSLPGKKKRAGGRKRKKSWS